MSTNLVSLYGNLYGSFYIATVLSTALYGIACMQTFFYYVHYRDDPSRVKLLVALMWIFNTIHEALSVAGAYKYIVAGLVDPSSALTLTLVPEFILQGFLTTLVALPTQGFLVYRIYIFSGKHIVAPVIWVALALFKFVPCIIYARKALYNANGVHVVGVSTLDSGSLEMLATIILSVVAAADILIAIAMTFLLVRERNAATFARTVHTLHHLTIFAVNTGIWTAMTAFMAVLLLHVFPENALYAIFAIPLCSVYCNTFLANLNVRIYIREEMARDIDIELFGQSSDVLVRNNSGGNEQRTHQTSKVEVLPGSFTKTESAV